MVKVIETNLSCDSDWHIKDHQARVIEVPSWNEYVDLFNNYDGTASGKEYKSLTNMNGYVLPSDAMIVNEEHDEHHLMCKLNLFMGFNEIKLVFLTR